MPPDHADRGVAAIEAALAEEGPLSVDALRERVEAIGVRSRGQAMYHLLYRASLDGLIVRGPMVDGKHAYVLVSDWLGRPKPVDRDGALPEFARRYLAGHGPASDRDLARWAGLPLRDARAGLGAIASELQEAGVGLVDLKRRSKAAEPPQPKLLGAYEPLLLGWTSREDVLGTHRELVTINGVFRPFALVKGQAVASWSMPSGDVALEPFGRLAKADRAALEAEAADVVRFLGAR